MPVHLYGQCADMRAIRKIADKHNLLVIEDNAQAIGARGDGFTVGELSDAVCTSFITQKNLGTFGDGGAVVTNNAAVDRMIRKLRNHGSDKRSQDSMSYNSRLDDIHAGVLSAKLKHGQSCPWENLPPGRSFGFDRKIITHAASNYGPGRISRSDAFACASMLGYR